MFWIRNLPENIVIDYALDKAISAGEMTNINGVDVSISNSNIGLVSKDQSDVKLNQVMISQTDVAMAIFQKKHEFGPARMKILNGLINESKQEFLLEKKSSLIFNDEKKRPNSNNLKELFYNK